LTPTGFSREIGDAPDCRDDAEHDPTGRPLLFYRGNYSAIIAE